MYNRNYYSRRGRTIERKKTEINPVIRPELVNVYYNYLKDNGLIPEPPAPVEDGSYVTYHINQEYSFPTSWTTLNSALGSMLDTFEVPVDITEVDSIRLEYTLTTSSSSTEHRPFNAYSAFTDEMQSGSSYYDSLPIYNLNPKNYTIFFYRTGASTFVASLLNEVDTYYLYPPDAPIEYVKKVDNTGSTMVVKSITVSTYANE